MSKTSKSKKPPKAGKTGATKPPVKKAADAQSQDLPHMDGALGGCQIHTQRGGTCTESSCDHIENCTGDRRDSRLASSHVEIHHLLPVSAVNGYRKHGYTSEDVQKIATVYRLTRWCIHQHANVVALPVKEAYLAPANTITGIDLPAHNLHHNVDDGYTDEVKKEIAERVWNKIRKNKSGEKPHFTPQKVINQFARLSDKFLQDVKDRGQRTALDSDGRHHGKGTKAALKCCHEGEVDFWYLAFSMACDDVAKKHQCFSL